MVVMRGGKAIIEGLKREGVKVAFGLPGGAVIELYDAIYDETDIRHILVRHEQCAAHAADGYARASGEVGVCIATSGPGATNLTTGIATAYMDSSPIVAITGNVVRPLIGKDAFQEIDATGITMPITKHNFRLTDPRDIPYTIKAAFQIAKSGRPGPVHIDFPRDVIQAEAEMDFPERIELPGYKPTLKGNFAQIKKAAELLANAERPVIMAGGGAVHSNATKELIQLAEMLGAPIITPLMGKSCVPESHPLVLGLVGMHGRKPSNFAVSEADVLLGVGTRFSDRSTGAVAYFSTESKKIHIDIDPAEIGKNVPVDVPIVGDARLVLQDLIKILEKMALKKKTAWIEKIEQWKKEFPPKYDYPDAIPLKPQQVMKEVMEVLGEDDIVTTEVGQCQMWAGHYLTRNKIRTFISSGGLGTMGFGFPAAMGAKVARPESNVVDIAGDGSFLMVCQDLATVVENNIPVVVLILDNRALGMVRQWQMLFFDKRYSAVDFRAQPDFVKLAEAFGARGELVERPGEVAPALKEAFDSGKPTVINVIVDRDECVFPMIPPGAKMTEMIG
ncbi:MAG: biosynthetic-type acetolactate synthase large subunit [Candidatus Hydrothermarchaeota archaeon]